MRDLGHIELDLPEPPEKATQPPPRPVDAYLRYGPKAEITHIFRAPEKRPPQELSLAFLGLVLVPLLAFLVGVSRWILIFCSHLFQTYLTLDRLSSYTES